MIHVRPARPDDAPAIAAIYAPHVNGGIASFEIEAPDDTEMARRMAASNGLHPWLVAEADAVLGYAYASSYAAREAYRWAVETTIYLAPGAQGKGIGRTLYTALLATLRAQGFTEAIAKIALPNPASVALHEALGFRHVGTVERIGWKHGRWVNVGVWQGALAEPATQPTELRRFADVGPAEGQTGRR